MHAGQFFSGQTLVSPIVVDAPGVTFSQCTFVGSDPSHTLLTTGFATRVEHCSFLGDYWKGARRGIAVNSVGVRILESRFLDLHHSQDAQAIAGWDGTADLLIEGCHCEASGENIMFGGADPSSESRIPQDIVIRRCTLTKPSLWKRKPNGCTVKNLFELKNAKRVLMEHCDLSQAWTDGQTGFGMVLTVRNQDNTAPYSTIEDVTIKNTIIREVQSGIQILGHDDTYPSGTMKRIRFETVRVVMNVPGTGIQIGNGGQDITFTDCYLVSDWHWRFLAFTPGAQTEGLCFTNGGANEGYYGITGDDTAPGTPSIDAYAPTAVFTNLTLWRGPSGTTYPYPDGITVV